MVEIIALNVLAKREREKKKRERASERERERGKERREINKCRLPGTSQCLLCRVSPENPKPPSQRSALSSTRESLFSNSDRKTFLVRLRRRRCRRKSSSTRSRRRTCRRPWHQEVRLELIKKIFQKKILFC